MPDKMFLFVVCVICFLVPVGVGVIGVNLPSFPSGDPGLAEGFKPIGALTVYYAPGG